MEEVPVTLREIIVVMPTSGWQIAAVIIGGITALLFSGVLIAQLFATFATSRAAKAAKESLDLAKYEMDLRLAPFISVPDLEVQAIKDNLGKVLVRRNPQTGEVSWDEARSKGEPTTVVYRIEMKNSGPIAAANMGHGLGQNFGRSEALSEMRADTWHAGTLVPPGSSITHDFDIALDVVKIYVDDLDRPYFVAFSVVYEDQKDCGFLVEVEWELRGNLISTLRHSRPEPYSGETILD